MLEDLAALPLAVAAGALWAFALVRGAGYYALGRLSRGRPGGRLAGVVERVSGGRTAAVEDQVARLGPRAIVLGYPFYGVSAATQIVSGAGRMPLPRFYLALAPPALIWASLQAVIGVAALRALVTGYLPWLLVAGAGGVLVWVLGRRWTRAEEPTDPEVEAAPPAPPA